MSMQLHKPAVDDKATTMRLAVNLCVLITLTDGSDYIITY